MPAVLHLHLLVSVKEIQKQDCALFNEVYWLFLQGAQIFEAVGLAEEVTQLQSHIMHVFQFFRLM